MIKIEKIKLITFLFRIFLTFRTFVRISAIIDYKEVIIFNKYFPSI